MAISEIYREQTATRLRMSYEEFLNWSDEDTHAEWVDGEVIVFMPAKTNHQEVITFLYYLLRYFVDLFDLGKVLVAPLEMKPDPSANAREPDILFVAKENLDRLNNDRLAGPADLIVEVVSGDSVYRDRDDKYREYREAGVREYWVLDPRPRKRRADFYALNENGDYVLFATEEDERVESRVLPGFWIKPFWLWPPSPVNVITAFYEIRGLTAEQIDQIQRLLRGDTP
jgi:Uma2 family endonuclease